MLSLAEEIYLLSLLDKKDSIRVPSSISLPFVLTGAVLIEMVLSEYAKVEDGRLVPCVDPEQITDEPMRYALEKIQHAEKPKKLDHWVYVLSAKSKRISKDVLFSLVEKGILIEKGKNHLLTPPPDENAPERLHSRYLLKREIRDAVLGADSLSERTIARIEFMDACDMLDHLFTKDEIIGVRKKLKTLKADHQLPPNFINLLNRVTEAIDYAITAAITA